MNLKKVIIVAGTRPEAIKLIPLYLYLRENTSLAPIMCNTGQHREMFEQVTDFFGVAPEYDLRIMEKSKTLCDIATHILAGIQHVYEQETPAMAIVQGDTTTALAAGLAAYYCGIPVAHVEAGLRTYDLSAPFPEEANRQCLARLASLHFVPTEQAKNNLLKENIPLNAIHVTGNTVIDALFYARSRLASVENYFADKDHSQGILALVTIHRRENHKNLSRVCSQLLTLANEHPDLRFVFPVHHNPIVRNAVNILEKHPSFALLEPLHYPEFIHWVLKADVLFSDSGGIQEEASALGKQVLLLRDTTERPEAVESGHVHIVGSDGRGLSATFRKIMDNGSEGFRINPSSIFGDGNASKRIADIIQTALRF